MPTPGIPTRYGAMPAQFKVGEEIEQTNVDLQRIALLFLQLTVILGRDWTALGKGITRWGKCMSAD